jgi:hypothetical protein
MFAPQCSTWNIDSSWTLQRQTALDAHIFDRKLILDFFEQSKVGQLQPLGSTRLSSVQHRFPPGLSKCRKLQARKVRQLSKPEQQGNQISAPDSWISIDVIFQLGGHHSHAFSGRAIQSHIAETSSASRSAPAVLMAE